MILEINPEIVCSIINRAREFHAKEAVVIPDPLNNPSEDWALQMLADHKGDLTYLEAKLAIDDLEPDQQVQLVALMWLGRGDYDGKEWKAALKEAWERRKNREAIPTSEYLLSTPLVADYLAEGLAQFGLSCEE